MNQIKSASVILLLLILLLGACGGPSQKYETGEVLLTESFDEPAAWETYSSGAVDFRVSDGAYHVQTGDEGYIWGLNEREHDNVVIEVTSTQHSSFENNAYGVMCRSDTSNNGDGYYFLISGDGYYAISKGEGDNVNELVGWTANSAINEGQATNTIRAVCIDNYLALYVNGKFIEETEDSDYSSGYAGFAATAFDDGDTDITFDNLTITAASFSN